MAAFTVKNTISFVKFSFISFSLSKYIKKFNDLKSKQNNVILISTYPTI